MNTVLFENATIGFSENLFLVILKFYTDKLAGHMIRHSIRLGFFTKIQVPVNQVFRGSS